MIRIKFILPFAFPDPAAVARRADQVRTAGLLDSTTVDCVNVLNHPVDLTSHYDEALLDMYVTERGLTAEMEGYSAVVMDTVSDSGVYPLRSRLSIPVIGPGQTAFAVASTLGKKFSLITYLPEHNLFYEKSLNLSGLRDRCASIRAAGITPDYESLIDGSEDSIEKLTRAALGALEDDGADVLILGSTTMHPLYEGLRARLDVPVIDPGPVALKWAETVVGLRLTHSKKAFVSPVATSDDMWHALPGLVSDAGVREAERGA